METLTKNHLERILIIQTAFLGDVLLTLPVIHHLKKINPAYKISLLIKKKLIEIEEIYPQVDEFIYIDKSKYFKSITEVVGRIKNKFDIVIAPHRSARTAIISYLSRSKYRISFNISSLSFLYTHLADYIKTDHEIQRNLCLLSLFASEINWKEKIQLRLNSYVLYEQFMDWKNSNKKIVVIAPGTVWETKRYPEYYFVVVIQKLIEAGMKIVLIGSNSDFEIGLRIQKFLGNSNSLINLIGKLKLIESISLINLSDLLICNDSAPTHMGVFTDTPVLTIYGSTVPEFGFYPFRESDRIIQVTGLDCKPCGIHGHKKCPKKHFKCMIDLKPELVFNMAIDILNK